jgi:hypothetical protein
MSREAFDNLLSDFECGNPLNILPSQLRDALDFATTHAPKFAPHLLPLCDAVTLIERARQDPEFLRGLYAVSSVASGDWSADDPRFAEWRAP